MTRMSRGRRTVRCLLASILICAVQVQLLLWCAVAAFHSPSRVARGAGTVDTQKRRACWVAAKGVLSEEFFASADLSKPLKAKAKSKRKKKSISDNQDDTEVTLDGLPAKSTKSAKKRKSNKVTVPIHWRNDSDVFLSKQLESHTSADGTDLGYDFLRFTVRGNPLPLRRHRTSKGFIYNPSAKAQESFRNVVQEMVGNITSPLFGPNTSLSMSLVFRTKRPNTDFVGGRPGEGRLRQTETKVTQLSPPPRTDVDNLAKFVLDSMNGLLYEDDRQIVSLHATKFRDNEGECKGSTEVCVRIFREVDLERLLNQTLDVSER